MIRRRRYYYENVFGVDQYSMKTLRALHAKYTRDYLTFFKSLSSMYGASPQKREIDEAVVLVQQVRGIIESILQSSNIDRADAKNLYEITGKIEEKKQSLLEQAADVRALRERLDRIQRETGLSTESLNVTRQIVRGGVRQAAGAQREGVIDFLSRAAPGTLELGRKLGRGAAAVLAGPFAPILGAGFEVAKGAAGVVGGIRKKMLERQERRFGGRLRTYTPSERLEDVMRARGMGTPLSGVAGTVERGVRRDLGLGGAEEARGRGMESLMGFWNKGAYRAKYTKELLSVLKDMRGKKGRVSLGNWLADAADDFKLLGVAMLPLLGKLGMFAALTGAVVLTGDQFIKLNGAMLDYEKSKRMEQEAVEALSRSVSDWNEFIVKEGIQTVAELSRLSIEEVARAQLEREKELKRSQLAARPFHQKLLGGARGMMEGAYIIVPEPIKSEEERVKEIIRAGGGTATETDRLLREQGERIAGALDKMTIAMAKWEERERVAAAKYPDLFGPNVHDSGDSLLNGQANGNLGLEE